MSNRSQDPGIKPGVACQLLSINLIAFPNIAHDRVKFGDVGNDYFMSVPGQLLANPNGVCSRLDRNPCCRHVLVFTDRSGDRAKTSFFDHVSFFVKHAVVTPTIANVNPDCDLTDCGFFRQWFFL